MTKPQLSITVNSFLYIILFNKLHIGPNYSHVTCMNISKPDSRCTESIEEAVSTIHIQKSFCSVVLYNIFHQIYYFNVTFFTDVTPSAIHVCNIVQGAWLAWAQGQDIGFIDDDSDTARKVRFVSKLWTNILVINSRNVYYNIINNTRMQAHSFTYTFVYWLTQSYLIVFLRQNTMKNTFPLGRRWQIMDRKVTSSPVQHGHIWLDSF